MKTPVHVPAPAVVWRLRVAVAEHDTLVFARVLQKTAVPEIELAAAAYTRTPRRIELTLRCTAARAELTRQKIERLAAVRATALEPAL